MLRQVTAAAVASTCRRTSSPSHRCLRHTSTIPVQGASGSLTEVQFERPAAPTGWQRFLQGGLDGISQAEVQTQQDGGGERVRISWADGHESEFSAKWLRDHCTEAVNPHTKQRQVIRWRTPFTLLVHPNTSPGSDYLCIPRCQRRPYTVRLYFAGLVR